MTEPRVRNKPVQHKKRNSSLFPIAKLLFYQDLGGACDIKRQKNKLQEGKTLSMTFLAIT